jgi:hypothetical protein
MSAAEAEKEKGDTLKRSFIRHDPQKLGKALYTTFRKGMFDVLGQAVSDISWPWL